MPVGRVSSSAARRSSSSNPTLRVGSRGPAVTRLQNALRAKGYRISADGAFGPRTLAAVRAFQRSRRLAADGVVGPRTWGALGASGGAAPAGRASGPTSLPAGPGRVVRGYRNGRAVNIRVSPVGGGQYLQTKAAGPYKALMAAARRAGIRLSNTSGYRTYAQQAALYRRYGSGRAARPGYSNHQLGLSMDIGGVGGYGTRAFRWLRANAPRFGFINDVPGEFWHWTYRR